MLDLIAIIILVITIYFMTKRKYNLEYLENMGKKEEKKNMICNLQVNSKMQCPDIFTIDEKVKLTNPDPEDIENKDDLELNMTDEEMYKKIYEEKKNEYFQIVQNKNGYVPLIMQDFRLSPYNIDYKEGMGRLVDIGFIPLLPKIERPKAELTK